MRWPARVRMALLTLFGRAAETERLSDELQFHIDQQTAENIAGGMPPEQARAAAMRAFGNPTHVREETREQWGWSSLEQFTRDLRYGARTLARSPGFALIAIVVMALGIGATTSLFTIVRAVLLKPLPFRDPQNLVMVYERFREHPAEYNVVAPADYVAWRSQTHGFEDMAAWRHYGAMLTGQKAELPEVVEAAGGSFNLFSVLGVRLAYGRAFTEEEDRPETGHVILLTWNLFQRRFNGDPTIVGKQVHIDTEPYTVVGVLPESFHYPSTQVQFWMPYGATFEPEEYVRHDDHFGYVVARTKPGVSLATATGEVSALQFRLHQQHPGAPVAEDVVSRPMIEDVVQDVKTPLLVLLCAVGCMLLIACLNVSNLLVARGAARRKEVAVRGALGGSRLRLIREQMTESLLICAVGGTLGTLLSLGATRWLASGWQRMPRAESVHVDGVVLAFSVALIVLAALLAGLVPAISSTGSDVLSALKDSSRAVGGSASRTALRKMMLVAEIALTVTLLVSAGLLFKSFLYLRSTDLGCTTDHVLSMSYGLPEKQYVTPQQVINFHEGLLQRVRALPGVRSAGLITRVPGAGYYGDHVFTIPEHPSTGNVLDLDAIYRAVDPAYFSTLQIPVLSGRVFNDQDRLDRTKVVIISKKLAEEYFPGENPIGKHLNTQNFHKREDFEIIGVVGDTRYNVAKPVKAMMYFPLLSGLPNTTEMTLAVRTTVDPLTLTLPIQKQVAALDAGLPVYEVYTLQQIVSRSTANESFNATLLLAFAGLSLLLAAVGLYGVLSYLVTQRVTEIGIRMALGARRQQVLWLVLLDGLRPVGIGLVLGVAGAAIAGALIRSILYGTRPLDLSVYAGMVLTLLLVAMLACAVPAMRAARIEPMQALRTD